MHELANPEALWSGACFKATVVPHCKSGSLLKYSTAFPNAHLLITNFFFSLILHISRLAPFMTSSGRFSLKPFSQSFFMVPDLNFPCHFHLPPSYFMFFSLIDYLMIWKKLNRNTHLNKSECRFNDGKKRRNYLFSSSHAWIIPTKKMEQTSNKSYIWTDYSLVSGK